MQNTKTDDVQLFCDIVIFQIVIGGVETTFIYLAELIIEVYA